MAYTIDPVINGQRQQQIVKVGDTLPIGAEVDYEGENVPSGWQEVENVLWENSSPSSAFAGSQVTLNDNISNYEYYEVYYNYNKDNTTCMSTKVPVTQATYLMGGINFIGRRKIEAPSGTSITIGDAYINGTYAQGGTLNNDYYIPIKIIGYKKQIKKIAPETPANGNIENTYGTSQENTYSQEYINNLNTYSTDEIRIGTYLGKPLYRKVIDFGALPNATTKSVAHGISNIDKITKIEGITYANQNYSPIPLIYNSNEAQYNTEIYVGTINIHMKSTQNRSSVTAMIYLEYTKTTD